MIVDPARCDAGMPRGTAALALALGTRAAETATLLTGRPHAVDPVAVLGHLLLPLVAGDTPAPAAPRPAGRGWIHADLHPDDEELFEILGHQASDAERLAALAQECRLPVTPYRTAAPPAHDLRPAGSPEHVVEPHDVTVVDLTAMWAGPLATMQVAAWGAEVVTVEPTSRPDGLRGSPAQFAALDRGKSRRAWDLRRDPDRAAFEDAVRRADVLVESFSDRVLPNLGYGPAVLRQLNPTLSTVAIRAFPAGSPEASWVAYGRGVHAMSGLGMVGDTPHPSLLAYPDPLAGLLAFGAVLGALGAPASGHVDVSLAAAIGPLLATAGAPLGTVDERAVELLRELTGGWPGAVIVPA